ncbi:MAG: Stk1 family PASTA domain-containing Ser/Thr kinase, partial [Oscillospiraceae bacterium]
DILENKDVAVKILKDEFLSNEDFKRRFRNESKAIAVLSHPNIVKIYDVGFSDQIQFIVMEFIDGITLKEYIQQQGTIKWKEAVHFCVQILRALQHAHDNGIVHRDIKPQNIMLLQDGTIKVMDFGIARFARETGKTISDKAIGSVHYISPEQARGEATDEKSDVYSIGVILYEMLTGSLPFDGDTPVGIAIKQMQMEPAMPRSVNPSIPEGLEEIIIRAMQKDPELRYQSAAEMLRDIDEFKQNPSVVFEYKYLNQDGTTKYFDKVGAAPIDVADDAEKAPEKKSYTMPILIGITVTCVMVALFAVFIFFKGLGNKPSEVVMMDLKGKTVEEAKALMPDLKFVISDNELSDEYDIDMIISHNPEKDTKVKVGSEVKLVVSSGMDTIKMPDYVNATAADAKAKIEKLGLKANIISKFSSDVASGNVVNTDPEAGEMLKKGDTVKIFVSSGPADMPTEVPSVLGLTEAAARTELTNKDFKVVVGEPVESDSPKGTVAKQSEKPGSKIQKGATVTIHLSTGVIAPVKKEAKIIVKKPSSLKLEDKQYQFTIWDKNGNKIGTESCNLKFADEIEFTISNELKGKLEDKVDVRITVMIDKENKDFAKYSVDFTGDKPTVKEVSKPNYSVFDDKSSSSSDTEDTSSDTSKPDPIPHPQG